MVLKAKELQDLSYEELEATYKDYQKKLFKLVNEQKQLRPEKPHLVPQTRKEIARLLTVMNEKKVRGHYGA